MTPPSLFSLLVVALTGQFRAIDSSSPFFAKSTVTASSQLSPQYSPADAALSSSSAWCPQENFTDSEYLQIDFGEKKLVKQIRTAAEASPAANQTGRRVTKYLIQVSADGVTYEDFEPISNDDIHLQIRTQYMRIVPLDFVEFPCMRIEIFGCKSKNPELCSDNNGGCSQTCNQKSKYCLFGKCFFNCHVDFLCTKWVECQCDAGYKLLANGKDCADINECDTNNGNCDQICENSQGSYQCKCHSGFSLHDKHKCYDINECDSNHGGCNQVCTNSYGSYQCECYLGFQLSNDNHTCEDIDECAENNGRCSDGCQNLQGTYICTCPKGFEVDSSKKNCTDTNECLLANGGCETNCHNTNGSFYCSCDTGFELYDDLKCRDIDECSRNLDNCNPSSTNCRNFQGGYECTCKKGYKYIQGDDFNCELISCPPLVESKGTTLTPQACLVVDGRKVNDTCTFSCQNGYELPDPQNDKLTCLDTGFWDAALISCQHISCPALPPIPNGDLSPVYCSVSGNIFDQVCLYSCQSGYKLNGQSRRKCQANGQWDVQAIPTCEREYPTPWITCPADITVTLEQNKSEYDITGLLEDPKSNVQNVQIYPEKYRGQVIFPYGETALTYVASNEIGVTANCTTDIKVRDAQAPSLVYCPEAIYKLIAGNEEAVTWREPEFIDNVKVVKVESSRQSGDTFQIGSTNVEYTAFDETGNLVRCSFVVNLKRRECEIPDDPDNAVLTRQTFGYYVFIRVVCTEGLGKDLFLYHLGSYCTSTTLVWTPPEIPDCVDSVSLPASGVCPAHMIPQQSVATSENSVKLCVKCPRGMKYDEALKDCVNCPVGYFSDKESSLVCTQCPLGKSNTKEGSKTCIDLCEKGYWSIDGFDSLENQQCMLCSIGTYQDQLGGTECKQCQSGYTTLSTGSTSIDDCGTRPTVSSFGPPSMVIEADENGRAQFECMAAGPPAPTFVIKKILEAPDGYAGPVRVEYITSGNVTTGLRYIILSVMELDAGLYSCTATNKFGSDTKYLTLNVKLDFGSGGGGSGTGR